MENKNQSPFPVINTVNSGKFNTSPLLTIITSDSSPAELAAYLDEAMSIYFEFFCQSSEAEPASQDSNVMYGLRRLRNALIEGSTGLKLG